MLQFILGVIALPIAALVVWLIIGAAVWLRASWGRWKPTFVGNEDVRARHAAGLAMARRVFRMRLPGGWVLAYQSSVRNDDDSAIQTWNIIRDALNTAALTPLEERHEIRTVPHSFPLGGERPSARR